MSVRRLLALTIAVYFLGAVGVIITATMFALMEADWKPLLFPQQHPLQDQPPTP